MKRSRVRTAALLVALTALFACNAQPSDSRTATSAPSRTTPTVPDALALAHDAYLAGDWIALGDRVRDVLVDPNASDRVRENAFELLEKGYEATSGSLPTTFSLPPGFEKMRYAVVHGDCVGQPFHRIFFWGRVRDASHIRALTVRRLPDQVLLEKGKHGWTIKHDAEGFEDFVLETQWKEPALPADGAYTVRVALDDGTEAETWFPVHGLVSSAVPEVRSPAASAVISDPNPTVAWSPFRSPEYAPFEWRTFNVYVGQTQDGQERMAWNFWTMELGARDHLRIGAEPGTPNVALRAGEYWMSVSASEFRKFGPVELWRESRSVLPFHVVR